MNRPLSSPLRTYRVVGISTSGQRVVLAHGLSPAIADAIRRHALELKLHAQVVIEPDSEDGRKAGSGSG